MEVIKNNGKRAPFSEEKVRLSIRKTGAGEAVVNSVMDRVLERLFDGIRTRELYKIVREELQRESLCYGCRYDLRAAILRMGPAGFKFEKYVSAILNAYQYEAFVPEEELRGACVNHEVDVVARKEGRSVFIEAKFRNDFSGKVNLKDTMATWSRFIDLVDGAAVGQGEHFDEVWVVTNATFSDRALKFGNCKGMKLLGWKYPEEHSFAKMVDMNALYPITVLQGLKEDELETFSKQGIMLCKDIVSEEVEDLSIKTGVSVVRIRELSEMSTLVIEGKKYESK